MHLSLLFILLSIISLVLSTNFTSIEEYILGDLEAHISLRERTKSSVTRVVHNLLNVELNNQLFAECGEKIIIIFENDGEETVQREQHDLIYAFLHPENGQQMLNYLFRPLHLKDLPENKNSRSSLHILIVDSPNAFLKIFEGFRDTSFENDAYYLVILNYRDDDWFNVARTIFAKAWQRYMINTSLMFLSNTEDEVLVFTFFPYTKARCEDVEPVLIQRIKDGKMENNNAIFPDKLKNFHGCPITVALLEIPPFIFLEKYKRLGSPMENLEGIEANLLKTLARIHNFTIEPVLVDEWGFVTRVNRSANGAIEALLENRANMTLGFFAISEERNSDLSPGFSYHTTSLVFVIPPERKSISRLIKPLSETVRIAVISTFCIGVVAIFISSQLQKRWRDLILGVDNNHPYYNLFLSGLSGSVTQTPFNNFARFILISWMVLCFMVNNFYLAKYFQFLTQSDDISLADTFAKIAERKYTIYIRPTLKEFWDDHPELAVHTKILPLNDVVKVEHLMQDPDTSAVMMHTSDIILYKNKVLYRDKPLMIASQHLTDLQMTIYYPNHSPFREAFNPFLYTLTTSGLFEYWVKKYIDPMFLVQKMKADHDEMVITIAHLKDIYWVMLGGWIMGFIVFLLELLSVKLVFLRKLFQ